MRLPIAITAILVAFLGLSTPVISQPPIQVSQKPTSNSFALEQFKSNSRLWRQKNISNYRYEFTRSCFCFPKATEPVIIEVRNGVTTSITYKYSKHPVDTGLFEKYNTIPKLFNIIRNALIQRADNLTVQYNPTLGYPTQINIDYDKQRTDDEIFITISNLQQIK
ncbi:hypothetical protein NIES4072_19250 [Nostoc commune NIES-4072]|uniref:Uncharacterized protein n=1 Tax=Nostoc commune NIES-4072 TaxID=2005467 RepID=A0A2R5FR19_NOSCO|nr:DUF6174 domain-containing protein [Nostoc commune]BBD64412.1 hypothetical protein NIES4070_07550 [Nostoc commune HK-02]GBG18261.1 hypothetical protein NIES4072_19250 [Nostoc commune NIES-4072]